MTKNSKKKDSNAENEVKEDFLDVQTSELNFSTPSSGGGAADNFENNVELEEKISEPSIYDILVEMRKFWNGWFFLFNSAGKLGKSQNRHVKLSGDAF